MLVCRNAEAGEKTRAEIQPLTQSKVSLELVDLSRPLQIQALASRLEHVDILVNNAGVLLSKRTLTPEGLETTFATNTLGVYYLTELLMPVLEKAKGRVITVSSGGMYNVPLSISDLQSETSYNGETAYAQTKVLILNV